MEEALHEISFSEISWIIFFGRERKQMTTIYQRILEAYWLNCNITADGTNGEKVPARPVILEAMTLKNQSE